MRAGIVSSSSGSPGHLGVTAYHSRQASTQRVPGEAHLTTISYQAIHILQQRAA
jgi:hypothetical protein